MVGTYICVLRYKGCRKRMGDAMKSSGAIKDPSFPVEINQTVNPYWRYPTPQEYGASKCLCYLQDAGLLEGRSPGLQYVQVCLGTRDKRSSGLLVRESTFLEAHGWLASLMQSLSQEDLTRVVVTVRAIWYARIKAIHDEQSFRSLCLPTISLIGSFWS